MRTFVIGSVSLVWMLYGLGPAAVDRGRVDLDALQAAFEADPDRVWWIIGSPEPSWIFYSGGRIRSGRPPLIADDGESHGIIEIGELVNQSSVPIFLEDVYLNIKPLRVARVAAQP
jgi:hypothetical protein